MVITQAGNDPKVVGLVYLAAYGPDAGESLAAVSANAPQTELTKYLVPSGGSVFIKPRPHIPFLTIRSEKLHGEISPHGML